MELRGMIGIFGAAPSAAMADLQPSSDLMTWSHGTARRKESSPSDAVSAQTYSLTYIDLCLMH